MHAALFVRQLVHRPLRGRIGENYVYRHTTMFTLNRSGGDISLLKPAERTCCLIYKALSVFC